MLDAAFVRRNTQRSLNRQGLAGSPVDLVQFHWWDLSCDGYARVLGHLAALTRGPAPLVRHVGVTNFDLARLREVMEGPGGGVPGVAVRSNQVQYSLLDARPAAMGAWLAARNGAAGAAAAGRTPVGTLAEHSWALDPLHVTHS